ncbi:unnamed protein product [Linum trigynum]|uniref:Uncharacterized protein n=1 Tax=Linum trigynum TaxID=586398 RepID=A0AAV2E7W4_9ROSI
MLSSWCSVNQELRVDWRSYGRNRNLRGEAITPGMLMEPGVVTSLELRVQGVNYAPDRNSEESYGTLAFLLREVTSSCDKLQLQP